MDNKYNIEKLRKMMGESSVDKCFLEYIMILLAKKEILDKIEKYVYSEKKFLKSEIEKILEGEDDNIMSQERNLKKNYTIETRLRLDKEQRKYLNEYILYYNEIYRYVWKRMTEPDFKKKYTKISIFVTEICNKFEVLKRTANTIRNDVQGRIQALTELKKLEKKNLGNKIDAVRDEIEKLKEKINLYKTKIEKKKNYQKKK